MDLREQVRPFFVHVVGNGLHTNAWDDKWLPVGNLSSLIPHRNFVNEGFTRNSSVASLILSIGRRWPDVWLSRCSALAAIDIPTLRQDVKDSVLWKTNDHMESAFSVGVVWWTLKGSLPRVPWYSLCWFPYHIPKHSFCLWLAILRRLPTQDRLVAWRSDGPDMVCPLCKMCLDNHNQIFFDCAYSVQIWRAIQVEAGIVCASNTWDLILQDMGHRVWKPGDLKPRLFFAASAYFIWQERNMRLFRGGSRDTTNLVKDIRRTVAMRCGGIARARGVRIRDTSFPNG